MSDQEKKITVVTRRRGYAHVWLQGTCDADVTAKDVEDRFFHPYLGGHAAWARGGEWGCIVHTD